MNANMKRLFHGLCFAGMLFAIGLATACETPKTKGEAAGMVVSGGLGALADAAVPFAGSMIAEPLTDAIGKGVADKVDSADTKKSLRSTSERKQDYEQYNRLREKSPEKYRKLQGDEP